MKKVWLFPAFAAVVWGCCAADWEINGDFSSVDREGRPANWRENSWSGYKPSAKYEILTEDDSKVLHIFDAQARGGFGWYSGRSRPASAGDRITISAQVRGKGRCGLGLQLRNSAGNHIGDIDRKFPLTGEWRKISAALNVVNTSRGETASVVLTVSGAKGSELFIRNIQVHCENSEFSGSASFPREWTVFAPVAPDEEPELTRIPDRVGSATGVGTTLTGSRNVLDFRPFFPQRKLRNTGWAFAELRAAADERHTIGVGADYFFALYVNGQKVLDTLDKGNAAGSPHFNNYLVTVPLRKGVNILAVKFQSGSGGFPHLCIGGANDLRGLSCSLGISKILEQDDYESERERPGSPRLIQAIISPGWLTVSRQAVYPAGEVILSGRDAALPPAGSGLLLAAGVRLQSFRGEKAVLSLGDLAAELLPDGVNWILNLRSGEKILKTLRLPAIALPADLLLARGAERGCCTLASLGDGKVRSLEAPLKQAASASYPVRLNVLGNDAELTVDNYVLGLAAPETKSADIPLRLAREPEFDPVKAKWPLIWQDEFDGDAVDLAERWFIPSWTRQARPDFLIVKDGVLHLRCELAEGRKRPQSVGIRSRRKFQFGYFEARVRFTRKPGWWAAFWLLDNGRSMPTAGGGEIDIFEDYATRRADRTIANNFHSFMGSRGKSYGYTFKLPGSLDDFYVIGCKWTPFEISIYLNGKLVKTSAGHSPWPSLTYDAMHHAFPTAPARLIVSGQVGSSGGRATGPFTEDYLVDYVRVYDWPRENLPSVQWGARPEKRIVPTGSVLKFSAVAASNTQSKSPVTGVYLFDNGYLMDCKSEEPYDFSLPLTQERYDMSRWGAAGRGTSSPRLDGYAHFYQLAVQDAAGQVAFTEPLPLLVIDRESTPYQGKRAEIPGRVAAGRFDEGGRDTAWYWADGKNRQPNRKAVSFGLDGSWVRYSVSVKHAGRYRATLFRLPVRDITRGKNFYPEAGLLLFVNDRPAGAFRCRDGEKETVLNGVELPEGDCRLTVVSCGGEIGFSAMEFALEADGNARGGARER